MISFMKTIILAAAAIAWVGLPVSVSFLSDSDAVEESERCPGGHSAARLTGWTLNNETPSGEAKYNESTRLLEVSIESVALPDGKVLSVLIGDDRVGELEPLKGGRASGSIMRPLSEGARISVFDAERPIVSANLQCVSAPTPTPSVSPTISPMPTASPTSTPTPSPSPTISPGPTAEPTQDPMPKKSPLPTPSPNA